MSIALKNISKSFGSVYAIEHLDLEVQSGEFVSLVGPSGCGKTTTLRVIAGFTEPDSGTVSFDGAEMNRVPARRRQVGIVFQDYALFPNLRVFDNVAFGLHARRRGGQEVKTRVAELLELVQLTGLDDRLPRELSGGQKQRVALARALAIGPHLLLLDEPLSALDAKVRLGLRYELRRIQRETGTTTIYVTHDQEEAMSVSDRIAVMHDGRIEQVGEPKEVYRRPATPFVADFIGAATLLEVEEDSASQGTVRWHDHTLWTSPYIATGRPRLLTIRPENVAIEQAPTPAPDRQTVNVLAGKVEGRVFLGASYRVAVDIDGVRFLADAADEEAASVEYGDAITVTFQRGDAWLL